MATETCSCCGLPRNLEPGAVNYPACYVGHPEHDTDELRRAAAYDCLIVGYDRQQARAKKAEAERDEASHAVRLLAVSLDRFVLEGAWRQEAGTVTQRADTLLAHRYPGHYDV